MLFLNAYCPGDITTIHYMKNKSGINWHSDNSGNMVQHIILTEDGTYTGEVSLCSLMMQLMGFYRLPETL